MNVKKVVLAVAASAVILMFSGLACNVVARETTNPNGCAVNGDTDSGKGGTQLQICKDHASVGVSGPIKGVDVKHPAGGHNAFLPKAGRDINHAGIQIKKETQHFSKYPTGQSKKSVLHQIGDRVHNFFHHL